MIIGCPLPRCGPPAVTCAGHRCAERAGKQPVCATSSRFSDTRNMSPGPSRDRQVSRKSARPPSHDDTDQDEHYLTAAYGGHGAPIVVAVVGLSATGKTELIPAQSRLGPVGTRSLGRLDRLSPWEYRCHRRAERRRHSVARVCRNGLAVAARPGSMAADLPGDRRGRCVQP
jgi:hypothetical protein